MTTTFRGFLPFLLGAALTTTALAQPPAELSPAEMLKRADTDGDGKVSRDEFIKARTARLEQAFARMDTDGDGKLDEREAEASAEQLRSMMGGGRANARRPDGPRPQRPDGERPQRPDGERPPRPDGERPPRPGAGANGEQAFDRFDADGDGTISREEFAAGMARMRESMPREGRGPGGPAGPAKPERGGRGPDEGFRRPPQQD